LRSESYEKITTSHRALVASCVSRSNQPASLPIDPRFWIELFHEVLGYFLTSHDIEGSKKVLAYLYTAAFTTFCVEKLKQLGYASLEDIRFFQKNLKVADVEAKAFYTNCVDKVAKNIALDFYKGRIRIMERFARLPDCRHPTNLNASYGKTVGANNVYF
jgi:hypothetical protein